jgi:hexosaminidase
MSNGKRPTATGTRRTALAIAITAISLTACGRNKPPHVAPGAAAPTMKAHTHVEDVLPHPALAESRDGQFAVDTTTTIAADTTNPDVARIAAMLSQYVQRASGLRIQPARSPAGHTISLAITSGANPEAYELTVAPDRVSIVGSGPAGLFYGFQTLRQLMPVGGEYEALLFQQPQPFAIPAVHVVDAPRFEWRGAMLDVARHFFGVDDIKRYIDLLALLKMNRLHLHLADDQGWRIEIKSRPALTAIGAATEVGGTPGGFFTQAQFADVVSYAAARFVMIVPEIDMPSHTNAAQSAYPELTCNGTAPAPYTGTAVGFSSLCVDREATYKFIDDVVGELAAISPGPYLHVGGDETKTLTPDQYATFVSRVQQIVDAHGKQMIGWDEIAAVPLLPTTIVQHWRPHTDMDRLAHARRLILSPADRAYLDMKYDDQTLLGLHWAGLVPLKQAYDWDPVTLVPGAMGGAVLGIEAPLWTETTAHMRDVEFLAFPRLAAVADVAWAPAKAHDWDLFRGRLGAQAPRWAALGLNFYRDPAVEWRSVQ